MMKISYCQKPPIREANEASFAAMTVDERIEIEEAMQRWRLQGVQKTHVYEWIGTRFEILVARVPFSKRRLVAVHDKNRNWIEAVNLNAGRIRDLVGPAYLRIGLLREPGLVVITRNKGWTG